MASDYKAILDVNKKRYGTDIGRIGPMLLADRYADRTHFIYELLQNAEDALARRNGWPGKRSVDFSLSKNILSVSHYGIPFTPADVEGLCGIAASTKDIKSIGRFGIGFKSVYAFTDCPEVHSGDEHFAIDNFVWPRAIHDLKNEHDETVFILPLRSTDVTAFEEIATGLSRLGARILLFLREIEEISWSIEGGPSGIYLRDKPMPFGKSGRIINLIGQLHGTEDIAEERWVIFSHEVLTPENILVGYIEVAFALVKGHENDILSVIPIRDSTLVVFFPTIVPTNLGLLIQGPYRTTPSRDNVPRSDSWNKYLIQETSKLLVEGLVSLRDNGLLNANALTSLPLERSKFSDGSMFAPMYNAIRQALSVEPLLPCFGGGHAPAKASRLARTQELRELINPTQLAKILQQQDKIAWLSEEITLNKMPELRRYLMQDLEIVEITPEMIIPKLNKLFLEEQSDQWVAQLYEYLNGPQARQRQLDGIPLIRLEDGSHVPVKIHGQLQAFLPSSIISGFPTVRRTVCRSEAALEFLKSIGLCEPDPVDDVIRNVLPKYKDSKIVMNDTDYAADIDRILKAFSTDSKIQREKLIDALRGSAFVKAVDSGDGSKLASKPGDIYLATQRLKDLFEGVREVLLVDDSYACLRGENVRDLLEACGTARYMQPVPFDPQFSWEEKKEMRRESGCADCSYDIGIEDFTLRGLHELLAMLPSLDPLQSKKKAGLLWDALCDVEDRRGSNVFTATYRWKYFYNRNYELDATFVRILNETPWILNNSKLETPAYVLFDQTGWKQNAFLLSKIKFKPPIIETLAREAGFEPAVLDLLKRLGVTSEAELKTRLGIKDDEVSSKGVAGEAKLSPEAALKKLGIPPATPPTTTENETLQTINEDKTKVGQPTGHSGGSSAARHENSDSKHTGTASHGGHRQSAGTSSGTSRPFISYVGVHSDDHESDSDGLTQEARIALEERAIEFILQKEPHLLRTPTNNPGFDLIEQNSAGMPLRWIEVKAMSKDLTARAVGLSRTQFDAAREHGIHYWLYVVEHADDNEKAYIVKIQDPAGKACTFTFDHGWRSVAEIDETDCAQVGDGE